MTTQFQFSHSTPRTPCRKRRAVPESRDIHYACQRCTNCCRWPGVVRVDENEITRIAAHVRMGEEEFIARHTRLRPDRCGLSLLEKADASCEWLDGRDCRLQAVKPAQCRAFPNEWNFPGWREKCEAVPSLVRREHPADG
jgi:Fe-S-cluster containining protein